MKTLTYKEAFDKITEAYIRGEIKPLDCKFCFCGTLSPDNLWYEQRKASDYPYTMTEYEQMEDALFSGLADITGKAIYSGIAICVGERLINHHPNSEEALFEGMKRALEVLRQIHIERGEIIDEVPEFTKRKPHSPIGEK